MSFLSSILKNNSELSTVKTYKDQFGIYIVVEEWRKSNTLFKRSTLSGVAPFYDTRTVVEYDQDGVTVVKTLIYTLTYIDTKLVSEVLQ